VFPGEGRGPGAGGYVNERRLRLHHGEPEERHDLHRRDQRSGEARLGAHRNGVVPGFTRKYGCKLLVWYQAFDDIQQARQRELQMKEWQRKWKIKLIEETNLDWDDLYSTLF
jgi:putative endonuclease